MSHAEPAQKEIFIAVAHFLRRMSAGVLARQCTTLLCLLRAGLLTRPSLRNICGRCLSWA